jgi:hypothetical protein
VLVCVVSSIPPICPFQAGDHRTGVCRGGSSAHPGHAPSAYSSTAINSIQLMCFEPCRNNVLHSFPTATSYLYNEIHAPPRLPSDSLRKMIVLMVDLTLDMWGLVLSMRQTQMYFLDLAELKLTRVHLSWILFRVLRVQPARHVLKLLEVEAKLSASGHLPT